MSKPFYEHTLFCFNLFFFFLFLFLLKKKTLLTNKQFTKNKDLSQSSPRTWRTATHTNGPHKLQFKDHFVLTYCQTLTILFSFCCWTHAIYFIVEYKSKFLYCSYFLSLEFWAFISSVVLKALIDIGFIWEGYRVLRLNCQKQIRI